MKRKWRENIPNNAYISIPNIQLVNKPRNYNTPFADLNRSLVDFWYRIAKINKH